MTRRLTDARLAVLLGGLYTLALVLTERAVGYVRDEGYYFTASRQIAAWWALVVRHPLGGGSTGPWWSDAAIQAHFSFNAEHPVFLKTLFGLSGSLLHALSPHVRYAFGARLPAMVLAGLLVAWTFRAGAEIHGRRAGLFAALALATLPRFFHDAHLACFDVDIAALQFATTWAYARSFAGRGGGVQAGLLLGLSLATKHNAWFLGPVLALHTFVARRERFARVLLRSGGAALRFPRLPPALGWMALLGPVTFVLAWPWLWHRPLARAMDYVLFHLRHEHYPVEYFGRILDRPPYPAEFPFVMTAVTVPLPVLALLVLGLVSALRRLASRDRPDDPFHADLLWLITGLAPLALIAMPSVPIFGGVKHWYTAMPSLCLLAGVEADQLLSWLHGRIRALDRPAVTALLAGLVLGPGLATIAEVHPYGIGAYGELIGGMQGAADAGMLRNFWGYTAQANLPAVNAAARPGDGVYTHRMNPWCFEEYQREGRLRPDLRLSVDLQDAAWATIHVMHTYEDDESRVWNDWNTRRPIRGVYVLEVPMNVLYARPRSAESSQ